jgi:hypothetical protein
VTGAHVVIGEYPQAVRAGPTASAITESVASPMRSEMRWLIIFSPPSSKKRLCTNHTD